MHQLTLAFLVGISIIATEGFKEVKYRCNPNCVSKKYYIGDDALSWEEASSVCENNGMILASVDNEKEFQFMKNFQLIEAKADRVPLVWLGATDRQNLNGGYHWIKNNQPLTFDKFSSPPSRDNIYETCVYQTVGSGWSSTYCTPEHLPGYARPLCESV